MSRVEKLRAAATELYQFADTIKNGDDRLAMVLRALVCEAEADAIERDEDPFPSLRFQAIPRVQGRLPD